MVNKNPTRSDEPVWWGLFGAGGTWFAMITPITILIMGILVPFGIISSENMSYEKASEFATSVIGALFIVGTLSLPMWHAMHRVHHGMHDLKIHVGIFGKVLCYAIALAITILAIVLVISI